MIRDIINLLNSDEFKQGSEIVQIAKGINKYPTSVKESIKQTKQRLRFNNKK